MLENAGYLVEAFIDKDTEKQKKGMDGIPVISPEQYLSEFARECSCVIINLRKAENIYGVTDMLLNSKTGAFGIVAPSTLDSKLKTMIGFSEDIVWIRKDKEKQNVIPYMEINIIDGCNLKCKGCTHFSSIYPVDKETHAHILPIDKFTQDMRRIRNVGNVMVLRLLGGEPLLIDNLEDYMSVSREIFYETSIHIVTNGILIDKMTDDFFGALVKYNITLDISPYKPVYIKRKQIVKLLDDKGINYTFADSEIENFTRNLTLEKTHDGRRSMKTCGSGDCVFIRNGRVYKCPIDGLLNDMGEYYGVTFETDGGFRLDEDLDKVYDKIREYALYPIETCRYCTEQPEMIPWEVKKTPELKDWLYHNGEF
jgi:organic radical activating enzyme